MPEDERIVRMNNLRRREQLNDVDAWMKSFLKAMDSLEEEADDIGATSIPPVTIDDFDEYLSKYVYLSRFAEFQKSKETSSESPSMGWLSVTSQHKRPLRPLQSKSSDQHKWIDSENLAFENSRILSFLQNQDASAQN